MPSGLRHDLRTVESYATLVGILIGAGIFKVTGGRNRTQEVDRSSPFSSTKSSKFRMDPRPP